LDYLFAECIRAWRASSKSTSKDDLSKTSKTCPLCRTASKFIVPSSLFPRPSKEAEPFNADGKNPLKDAIMSKYLSRLRNIPCRYFEESIKRICDVLSGELRCTF